MIARRTGAARQYGRDLLWISNLDFPSFLRVIITALLLAQPPALLLGQAGLFDYLPGPAVFAFFPVFGCRSIRVAAWIYGSPDA